MTEITRRRIVRQTFVAIIVVLLCSYCGRECRAQRHENVILITMDGFRWQELFGGIDDTLLGDKENGTENSEDLQRRFSADTPEDRREKLMPFFWRVVAKQGIVFGNPERNSHIQVSNGMFFSYPGYSELLCGFADPRIDSNRKINNPGITVLEWLHRRDGFDGRIEAYASWDVFPWIINEPRSGIPVNAGWDTLLESDRPTEDLKKLQEVYLQLPRYWDNVRYDVFTASLAEHALRTQAPRVLYVALGETDDWAHSARYDLYLDAASRNDSYIKRLWETAQSIPHYRDRTALVITTDHGRGDDRITWRSHGEDVPGCDRIWAAVLGPNVDPSTNVEGDFPQASIAATVTSLLGVNYHDEVDNVQPPLPLKFFQDDNSRQ